MLLLAFAEDVEDKVEETSKKNGRELQGFNQEVSTRRYKYLISNLYFAIFFLMFERIVKLNNFLMKQPTVNVYKI